MHCKLLATMSLVLLAVAVDTDVHYGIDLAAQADWNKLGIGAAKAGRLREANLHFRAAAMLQGHRGDIWANVGLSLQQMAQAFPAHDAGNSTALNLLREALAAFDLATNLGNVPAGSMRETCLAIFEQLFPTRCVAEKCTEFNQEAQALKHALEGQHILAVNELCTGADMVRVSLSARELSQGLISPQKMRRLWVLMRVCGVVALKAVFPEMLMTDVATAQEADFVRMQADLLSQQAAHSMFETTRSASRSRNRFEVKFPLRPPFIRKDFYSNRFMLGAVKTLLSNSIEIDTFSHITSLPDAPHQPFHADVGYLFARYKVIHAGNLY